MKRTLLLLLSLTLAGCATFKPAPMSPPAPTARTVKDREGIATGWGEHRESWVKKTNFVRAWGDIPGGSAMLYYNDAEGVDGMLDYLGGDAKSRTGLFPIANGLVSVGLRDRDGQWFAGHELKGRRFITGIPGERYEIVLKNETASRLEVVLSVDGLDVLDGQTASTKKRGYVLDAHESAEVDGFRTSDSSVAAFRFSTVPESYAALKHRDTRNVGVIGAAVFQERWGSPVREGSDAVKRVNARPFPGEAGSYAKPPDA